MNEETVSVEIWGDTYTLRANWAEASSAIERFTASDESPKPLYPGFEWDAADAAWVKANYDPSDDGCFSPTGYQVADFGHCPVAAMREELRQIAESGSGTDWQEEYESEIDAALEQSASLQGFFTGFAFDLLLDLHILNAEPQH
jgi:hypothetical protein